MSHFFRVVCITLFLGTMACAVDPGDEVGALPGGVEEDEGAPAPGAPDDGLTEPGRALHADGAAQPAVAAAAPAFVDACLLPGSVRATFAPVGGFDAHDEGVTAPMKLPFPFTLYGRAYRDFWLTPNGQLGFGTTPGGSSFGQVACPLADAQIPAPVVFAYSADLIGRIDGDAGVCIATTGIAPRRRLIVTWKDSFYYDAWLTSHVTFSATLHEATNLVDVAIDRVEAPTLPILEQGLTAVVGRQAGGTGQAYSCHEPIATAGTLVRFAP